ncbi:hypothetical protein SD1617_2432 [Shigella dysenteriae 1617]|nr:hypothetical protein SD1617_2432 [Shigella dysenteriae 1617]
MSGSFSLRTVSVINIFSLNTRNSPKTCGTALVMLPTY